MEMVKFLYKKKQDLISYKIEKNKNKFEFENILKINKNPFKIKIIKLSKKKKWSETIKLNLMDIKIKKIKLNIKSFL